MRSVNTTAIATLVVLCMAPLRPCEAAPLAPDGKVMFDADL